jgi:hypothetical protein
VADLPQPQAGDDTWTLDSLLEYAHPTMHPLVRASYGAGARSTLSLLEEERRYGDGLAAQINAMRPVLEAAQAWFLHGDNDATHSRLIGAVDLYRTQEGSGT